MTHIKTVKVTNPKNVLVQLPRYIVDKWGLKQGDELGGAYRFKKKKQSSISQRKIC